MDMDTLNEVGVSMKFAKACLSFIINIMIGICIGATLPELIYSIGVPSDLELYLKIGLSVAAWIAINVFLLRKHTNRTSYMLVNGSFTIATIFIACIASHFNFIVYIWAFLSSFK